MEIIERIPLRPIHFLNSITFDEFKQECQDDALANKKKKPKLSDINSWFKQLKQFCKCNIKTKGITTRIYSYSAKSPAGLGGRLFCGGSIQGIWGKYRGLLMNGISTDIDMANAHPVILRFICKKHVIECPQLEYYINNRDECLSKFSSRNIGKTAYLIATNKDKICRNQDNPQHFKDYDKEMKKIQEKLINLTEYKELFDTVPEDKRDDNYNGCAVNRILCFYENIILQHAIHIINKNELEIAVLMFDGCQIYGNYYENSELLNEISNYVDSQMPDLNMSWTYKEHDTSMYVPEDFDEEELITDTSQLIANCDNDAAIIIFDKLKDILIPSSNGRLFYKHDNKWICDLSTIDNYILNFILTSNIKKKSPSGETSFYVSNITSARHIKDALYIKINTQSNVVDIYEKFHTTTKHRLSFKDGVLDFKAKMFYNWSDIKFEYYSTECIDYDFGDYFRNHNETTEDTILKDIYQNVFGNQTKKALNFLSRAIAGHFEDKNWATYLGNRDCGKGVLYDNLKNAFGSYVKTFELGNIMYDRMTDTQEVSRKLYWLLDYEFSRLGISQETPPPSTNLKVNGKILKKLAGGGDEHVARRNFDRIDTHFKIDTTFMFFGNNELKVDVKDCMEHCIEFSSVNQFKTQEEIDIMKEQGASELLWKSYKIKDFGIKDKCSTIEWKKATVYLLYKYYTDKPVVVVTEKDEDSEVTIREKILEEYEITGNSSDYILVEKVISVLNDCKKKITNELISMGVTKKKSKNRDNTREKVCYFGIKIRPEEIVEEGSKEDKEEEDCE